MNDKVLFNLRGIVEVIKIEKNKKSKVKRKNIFVKNAGRLIRNLIVGENEPLKLNFGDLGLTDADNWDNVVAPSETESTLVHKLGEVQPESYQKLVSGNIYGAVIKFRIPYDQFNGLNKPNGETWITEWGLASGTDDTLFTKQNFPKLRKNQNVEYEINYFIQVEVQNVNPSLIPLNAPIANADKTTINAGEIVTLTATNIDQNAIGIEWSILGDYIIQTGNLNSTTLTIIGNSGTISAKVKAKGDNINYSDSPYSNELIITVNATANNCDPLSYDTSLTDGQSLEGIGLTDPTATVTVYFNKLIYDPGISPKTGFFDVNGTIIKIDYAVEYEGNTFIAIVGNTTYTATFVDTGTYTNPTVMQICQ